MKSRRQSSGGSSAAAVEGHTTHTGGGGGCKLERKDVEKKRRLQMKALCLKLSSLIPPAATARHASSSLLSVSEAAAAAASASNPSKDAVTQLDQLDVAAAYIKQLKDRIAALKRRKEGGGNNKPQQPGGGGAASSAGSGVAVRMPVVEARCQDGTTLDVVLISEAGRPFKLHEVITVLEQEGAEVVSASFSVVGDKIFYTVHSQALCPRIGLDAARVSDRLRGLLHLVVPV